MMYYKSILILITCIGSLHFMSCDDSVKEPDPKDDGQMTMDTIPPSPPVFESAVVELNSINLTWIASSEADLSSYQLFRGETNDPAGAKSIAQLDSVSTSFMDEDLEIQTTYTYWMVAIDTAGNKSEKSQSISATIIDNEAPRVPRDVTITLGVGQVRLDWSGNSESDLGHYSVYRGTSSDFSNSEVIERVSPPHITYTDQSVENGSTYYYWLTASDTLDNQSQSSSSVSGTPRKSIVYTKQLLLFQDDFESNLDQFTVQQIPGGTTELSNGVLEIDDLNGCTIWFNEKLTGNVSIEYDVVMVDEGGPNDRVSDLNAFWMATDPQEPSILSTERTGQFADYHCLQLYYVGYGARDNETTRFRRYPGNNACDRPLLPAHDLADATYMNYANETRHIQIVNFNGVNVFKVDGKVVFYFIDENPYLEGWFGFRTVANRMRIDNFRVYRLM